MRRHRRIAAAIVAVGLALAPAGLRSEPVGDAVQSVIGRQIEAFLSDDFDTAFNFASPAIQGLFGNPDRFGEMVRNGYPMVWRPADVRYGALNLADGRRYQTVIVRDGNGRTHYLEYEMIEIDGAWRINGVRPIRPPDAGA